MVHSKKQYWRRFWRKKSFFSNFLKNACFHPKIVLLETMMSALFWYLRLVVVLASSSSKTNVSKELTSKCETDFLKMSGNCQKSLP